MGKTYSVFEVTQYDFQDRAFSHITRQGRASTCVLETRRVADAVAMANQSDTLAIVTTFGDCCGPDFNIWADVHSNGKEIARRAASPAFSKLVTVVTKDAQTGRVNTERLDLSPIVELLETEDNEGSCCPHCGADGRYIKVFRCEDGVVRKAMSGCFNMWPKSRQYQRDAKRRQAHHAYR